MYINDRHRVQMSIPASCMYWAYFGMLKAIYMDDEPKPEEALTLAMLKEASYEPFEGLPPKKQQQLVNRADRACHTAMDEYAGASAGRILAMCVMLANELQDRDYITVVDGGKYAEAVELIVDALNRAFDTDNKDEAAQNEKLLSGARKQVPKIIARLKREGYYQ